MNTSWTKETLKDKSGKELHEICDNMEIKGISNRAAKPDMIAAILDRQEVNFKLAEAEAILDAQKRREETQIPKGSIDPCVEFESTNKKLSGSWLQNAGEIIWWCITNGFNIIKSVLGFVFITCVWGLIKGVFNTMKKSSAIKTAAVLIIIVFGLATFQPNIPYLKNHKVPFFAGMRTLVLSTYDTLANWEGIVKSMNRVTITEEQRLASLLRDGGFKAYKVDGITFIAPIKRDKVHGKFQSFMRVEFMKDKTYDAVVFGSIYGKGKNTRIGDYDFSKGVAFNVVRDYLNEVGAKSVYGAWVNTNNLTPGKPFVAYVKGNLKVEEVAVRRMGALWKTGETAIRVTSDNLNLNAKNHGKVDLTIDGKDKSRGGFGEAIGATTHGSVETVKEGWNNVVEFYTGK